MGEFLVCIIVDYNGTNINMVQIRIQNVQHLNENDNHQFKWSLASKLHCAA